MRFINQFSKFILVGGLAAAANFLSRFLFNQFVPYVPSIVLAFFVGLITGFVMMRAFVFSGRSNAPTRQASYYLLVNLVGLVLTVVVSVAVAKLAALIFRDTAFDEAAGHLVGVASPVLLSFYAHKKLTFR
jgi:putative flippase GtrA